MSRMTTDGPTAFIRHHACHPQLYLEQVHAPRNSILAPFPSRGYIESPGDDGKRQVMELQRVETQAGEIAVLEIQGSRPEDLRKPYLIRVAEDEDVWTVFESSYTRALQHVIEQLGRWGW